MAVAHWLAKPRSNELKAHLDDELDLSVQLCVFAGQDALQAILLCILFNLQQLRLHIVPLSFPRATLPRQLLHQLHNLSEQLLRLAELIFGQQRGVQPTSSPANVHLQLPHRLSHILLLNLHDLFVHDQF